MEQRAGRVVYVDFSETATHADTLFSARRFLEPFDVHWILDPSYRGHLPEGLDPGRITWLAGGRNQLGALRAAWIAAGTVRRLRPHAVHVNGAQGRRTRAFAVLAARSPAIFSGTIHNAGKLTGSASQRVIHRRIRRYAVLADFIRDHVAGRLPAGIRVETVRPIYFPGAPGASPAAPTSFPAPPAPAFPAGPLRVAIIGSLHPDRRDYAGLIRLLAGGAALDSGIELAVLGDASTTDGRAIRRALLQTAGGPRFTFVERFLEFPDLFREVAGCHAVLPLIHPDTPRFEEYRTVKITGASLLAFGFRKPMLLHRSLAELVDYRDVSIPYDVPDLVGTINSLVRAPERLAEAARGYAARTDLDFEGQAERFRKLIGLG